MRLEFDIYEFLTRQLPHHKRQTNRLGLFHWALKQLEVLWVEFRAWRLDMVYQNNVTGQRLSLIDFLNRKIAGADGGITIIETSDGGVYFSNLAENTDAYFMSISSEATDYKELPINGELLTSLLVDFQVLTPAGVNIDEVNTIISRYVLAGKNYEIIN